MRNYGLLSPIIQLPPDSVQTLFFASGVGQAMDWPNTTGGASPDAGTGGVQVARFTAQSSLGVPCFCMINIVSTNVSPPSSGTSVTTGTSVGSTGNSIPCSDRTLAIPSYSTGWSAVMLQGGYVICEVWHR